MQKNLEEITLKDLMDKLNEMRLEKQKNRQALPLHKISVGGLLSLDDLADFLGTDARELALKGTPGERYTFFKAGIPPA